MQTLCVPMHVALGQCPPRTSPARRRASSPGGPCRLAFQGVVYEKVRCVIDERRKLPEESDVDLSRTLVKQVVEALIGQQSDIRGMARHCARTWLTLWSTYSNCGAPA